MKVDIGYVWERFHSAVLSLASGPGGIKDRLVAAWFLDLDRLDPDEYPEEAEELAKEVRELLREMTAEKAPQEDTEQTYRLSAAAMTEDQAAEHAKKIVGLLDDIIRLEAFQKHLEEQARRSQPGQN